MFPWVIIKKRKNRPTKLLRWNHISLIRIFCPQVDADRRRIALDGPAFVGRIQKVFIGLEGHPVGPALFLVAHRMAAKQVDISEAGPGQPVGKAGGSRHEIGAWYLGVTVGGKERYRFVSWDALRFDDQQAARSQGFPDLPQHFKRGDPVVDNAHEEDDVEEAGKQADVFDAQQFDMQLLKTGKGVQGFEGEVVLEIRLKAYNEPGFVAGHPEHVVAVVATDIGNDLAA